MIKYEFIDKALWFPLEKILVISDLHIGYEDSLNASGVYIPRSQFEEIISDLKKIFLSLGKRSRTPKINEIIINGDLKHEFGTISQQEWRETLGILDFLQENSKKIVLVKGNHDSILEPIAKRRGIKLEDYYLQKGILFMHGNILSETSKLKNFDSTQKHEVSDEESKLIKSKETVLVVLGHRHPAIVLADKYKQERYKCFLVGNWKSKKIIILPSFFPLVEGSEIGDIDEGKFIIPETKLEDFKIYAVGDKVYDFGKLKKIGKLSS